ncbi:hypothetical protein K4E_11250 [Enterococcus thailandicus]|nr:hypothetical protein K4E_11250 [Enterococcus thailandicus]
MKKTILDIFKYSGISFFATFLILVALIIPNGVNSFLNGTSFQVPLNMLTIAGVANGSENSLEIHFTQIFFWQILLLYLLTHLDITKQIKYTTLLLPSNIQ